MYAATTHCSGSPVHKTEFRTTTSPRSVSFYGTQRALALLNAVGSRQFIDRFIEIKTEVNK